MHWANWFMGSFYSNRRAELLRQVVEQCEEQAWTLVEGRALWMGIHELRGYARARTRLLLEHRLKNSSLSVGPRGKQRELLRSASEQLITSICRRAEMAQSHAELKRAA